MAIKFVKDKKILGFINCPISKEHLFKNKYQGITEFLSKKTSKIGNEVMLIYGKELSVSPVTTHIPLSQVNKKINQYKIVKKVKIVNNFYKKIFNKKPNFAILGLNPHNFSSLKKSEEKEIINKAIKTLIKLKVKVTGPIAPDSSFMIFKKYKFIFTFRIDDIEGKQMISYGLFVLAGGASAILVSKVDMMMIGKLMNLESVAFYTIAFFIGNVILVPSRAIGSITAPLIAKAWKEKNVSEIKDIYENGE